jgi:hypothetical protein
MRHLKTFSLFESAQELTPEQVQFLDKYTDGTWSVNPSTGLVDVKGNFKCYGINLKDFNGVRFGEVTGSFVSFNNLLQSLEGAPETVGGDFNCSRNSLLTLEGAPKTVGRDFDCAHNSLQTLEGAPQTVGRDFDCSDNSLQTLEGAPETVGGDFSLDDVNVPKGGWTMSNLVKKYLESSGKKKDLLGTLVTPERIQKAIDKNPEKMAVELKDALKDLLEIPGYQNIKFPQRLQGEADLLSDLSGVGL